MSRQTWIVGAVIGVHAVVAVSVFSGCQSLYTKPKRGTPEPSQAISRPLPPSPDIIAPRPLPAPPVVTPRPAPTPRETTSFDEPTTTYTIRKGETISGIAARYSLNQHDIIALNKLADPDKVRAGEKLKLPGKIDLDKPPAPSRPTTGSRPIDGDVYEVKSGDTLSELALRFKVAVEDIRKANNLRGDLIRVGQKLTIPSSADASSGARRTDRAPDSVSVPEDSDAGSRMPPPEIPLIEEEPAAPRPTAMHAESASPDAQGASVREVVVKAGEDLVSLSMAWGVSPFKIKRFNNLESDQLVPGQKILIPEPTSTPVE